jgi:hypothetical protein
MNIKYLFEDLPDYGITDLCEVVSLKTRTILSADYVGVQKTYVLHIDGEPLRVREDEFGLYGNREQYVAWMKRLNEEDKLGYRFCKEHPLNGYIYVCDSYGEVQNIDKYVSKSTMTNYLIRAEKSIANLRNYYIQIEPNHE